MASKTYPTHSNPSSMRDLPAQYWRVITRPSVQTFTDAQEKASWGSTWLQLIVLGVLNAVLYVIYFIIAPPQLSSVPGVSASSIHNIALISVAVGVIMFTPLSFLLSAGVLYTLAHLFKGDGSYLKQVYTLTLIGVPMVLLSSLLLLIPAISNWLPYLPHLYSIVLVVLAIRAIHHLSTGKAIAVLALPGVIILALGLCSTVLLLSAMKH